MELASSWNLTHCEGLSASISQGFKFLVLPSLEAHREALPSASELEGLDLEQCPLHSAWTQMTLITHQILAKKHQSSRNILCPLSEGTAFGLLPHQLPLPGFPPHTASGSAKANWPFSKVI